MILRKKEDSAASAMRKTLVMEEKNRLASEKQARETASKVRAALLANPAVKKIKQNKSGQLYFNPRVNGKMAGTVLVS